MFYEYPKWLSFAIIGFLIIITLIAYFKIFGAEFVYDDFGFIVNNKAIQSLTPFSKFFTDPNIFTGSDGGGKNWRPISSLVFAIEYNLFGASPFGFHFISVILHLINIVSVYFLTRKVTSQFAAAIAVSSLWALHPVLTEAVSWASNQSSLIFLGFFILSVLALLKFSENNQKRHLFTSYLFFGLSLLTKETALGGIFVIIFIFSVYLKKYWKLSLPFIFAGLLYFYAHYKILGGLGDHALRGSFLENLLLAPVVFAKYLFLAIWPFNLLLDYTNFILPSGIFDPRVVIGVLLFAVLSLAFYFGFKKSQRSFNFGIIWFVSFLLPVMQVIPFQDIVGERFLYAPLIGFFLSAVLGLKYLLKFIDSKFNLNLNKFAIFLLLLVLSIFLVLTLRRNNDWLTSENLWLSVLRVDAKNERALQNVSAYYLEKRDADKLIKFSGRLLELNSESQAGRLHLAVGKIMKGQYREAESELLDLIKKYPDFKEAKNNLSVLYQQLGQKDPFIDSIIVSPVVDDENIINSGIFGNVFLGENPYEASLNVLSATGALVISVRSHSDGAFQIPLKPGIYILKPVDPDGVVAPVRNSYNFTIGNSQWLQVKIEYK